jgi:hypothetical protein
VLYQRADEHTGNRDVWYAEVNRGLAHRLTTDPANDWQAVWSPDGRRILFTSDRGGGPKLTTYIKESMDPGLASRHCSKDPISTAGRRTGREPAIGLRSTGGTERTWTSGFCHSQISAYLSRSWLHRSLSMVLVFHRTRNGSRTSRMSLAEARCTSADSPANPQLQATKSRSRQAEETFPAWRGDGTELFYIGGDRKVHSIRSVDLGSPDVTPRSAPLFTPCSDTSLPALIFVNAPWQHPYDVTQDGQRFVFHCSTGGRELYEVLLDWRSPK